MHFSPPADLFGEQGIIVLVVIALVLFGSTQIPKLARSLGSARKEFKKGIDEGPPAAEPKTKAVIALASPAHGAGPAPAVVVTGAAAVPVETHSA
jgi:sec-independent protein translocase protein TatA